MACVGHSDRQTQVDRRLHLVSIRVDNRDGIAISIGDQHVPLVERQPGRVQTGRDRIGDRHRAQINHRNGTSDCGAHERVGDDFRAGGVDLEVRLGSGAATLVADVGGRAVGGDHDAVRRVADANLRTLRRRVRGQVDLGERIVLVQQGVCALAIARERDTAGIRGVPAIERAAGVEIRGWRAVRKAGDEGIVRRHVYLGVV